jgi:hypothetical protein
MASMRAFTRAACGNRGTQLWQREQWVALPDIPFVGMVLTMPDVFWPMFHAHRHLQHDLPSVGAAVLQQGVGIPSLRRTR